MTTEKRESRERTQWLKYCLHYHEGPEFGLLYNLKIGMVVHLCNPSAAGRDRNPEACRLAS